jgi:pseudouridine-5'-phosphate glycosidase
LITIGNDEYEIESGDVAFVTKGMDHRIVALSDTLDVLEFVDKPGLADEFRAWHKQFSETDQPVTLEQVNKIANMYGTVYKTLE